MECIIVAIANRLVSSSCTNVITWCNKPNLSNKTCSCITIYCQIVSFTSNNPTLTWMGTYTSFRKLNTRSKVSTPLWNIHKSKLAKIIIADARFAKTCGPRFFWPWLVTFLPQEKTKKQIKHDSRHGITLTFEAKHYHKWTKACNFCKYTTPNPPKIIIVVHQLFYKGL